MYNQNNYVANKGYKRKRLTILKINVCIDIGLKKDNSNVDIEFIFTGNIRVVNLIYTNFNCKLLPLL